MKTSKPLSVQTSRQPNKTPEAQKTLHRLVIDTGIARHFGQPPQDVTSHYQSKSERANRTADSSETHSADCSLQKSSRPPLLHRRIAGLQQSTPDSGLDVSPSERSITIGLALQLSDTSTPPQGASSHANQPKQYAGPRLATKGPEAMQNPKDVPTPTIVITPAEEYFEAEPSQKYSVYRNPCRPTSSVYSRYTNCFLKTPKPGEIPPVPPTNLAAISVMHRDRLRLSSNTMFEEDVDPDNVSERGNITACRNLETRNLDSRTPSGQQALTPYRLSSRNSKGWWNIITSPFSGKSSTSVFWRSPSLKSDSPDSIPILRDASAMGTCASPSDLTSITGVGLESGLRSAPASGRRGSVHLVQTSLPRRSNTSPGALSSDQAINIYTIPNRGAAAAYYDPTRPFPTPDLAPTSRRCSHQIASIDSATAASKTPDEEDLSGIHAFDDDQMQSPIMGRFYPGANPISISNNVQNGPDHHVADAVESGPLALPKSEKADRGNFPTPSISLFSPNSVDKKLTAVEMPPIPADRDRNAFSPDAPKDLSSPIASARNADTAEYRPKLGLGASTMSHRSDGIEQPFTDIQSDSFQPVTRPDQHASQTSQGLGISCNGKEKSASARFSPEFPSEKLGLCTDKFGQLTIGSLEDEDSPEPRKLWLWWALFFCVGFALMVTVTTLVALLPIRHSDMNVAASWLNLTGFPPIPTGISTMIQPHSSEVQNGCVSPASLWSCGTPGMQQSGRPNFRFEIRFRNGTVASNETALSGSTSLKRGLERRKGRQRNRRSLWTELIFDASPSPPSTQDQIFLGQTTDNNSAPFNGEESPFYISLLNPAELRPASSTLSKRDQTAFQYPYPDQAPTNVSTSGGETIPQPALNTNGEPVPPDLYPLVSSQPLRLYNRGLSSEHYGFYAYFDRSVYIAENTTISESSPIITNVPLDHASAVCTWSQTRMLVQIWTQLSTSAAPSLPASPAAVAAGNSSANAMSSPGSFPYPVTVTLDRHGGVAAQKGVYCYALDAQNRVVDDVQTWISEDRAAGGGTLVNPASVPTGNVSALLTRRSAGSAAGGIDGGTGGCMCQWQNWD